MAEKQIVWITKYALTKGVFSAEVVKQEMGMVTVKHGLNGVGHFHGNAWHFSCTKALDHAEDMRVSKIESLKQQIAKLEKLEFKP